MTIFILDSGMYGITSPVSSAEVYDVTDYGAVADWVDKSSGGAISSSSTTFTDSTNSPFTSGDVGKRICIDGAGTYGTVNTHETTISSYQSASQVTLASSADVTVNNAAYCYGTDSASAMRSAVNAAEAADGGTVYIPAGDWFLYGGINVDSQYDTGFMQASIPLKTGVYVVGDGIGNTVLHQCCLATMGRSIFGGGSINNFGVNDMTLTTPLRWYDDQYRGGIKMADTSYGEFENIYMEHLGIGSNAIGCQHLTYDYCEGYHCGVAFMQDEQVEGIYCYDITLNDCEASYCTMDGIAYGFAAYLGDGDSSHRVERVNHYRCFSHHNNNGGFYSKWSDHCTWVDCVSEDHTWACVFSDVTDYWVDGCTSARCTNSAFPTLYSGTNNERGSL